MVALGQVTDGAINVSMIFYVLNGEQSIAQKEKAIYCQLLPLSFGLLQTAQMILPY